MEQTSHIIQIRLLKSWEKVHAIDFETSYKIRVPNETGCDVQLLYLSVVEGVAANPKSNAGNGIHGEHTIHLLHLK